MPKYCPECKCELEIIGVTGCGQLYRCPGCKEEWRIGRVKEEDEE